MSLNTEQINALLAPLNPARVRQVQGNAHLEAWDVRRWLLRIFGWGGWDFTVSDCTLIQQIDLLPADPKGKTRYTVVYRVIGKLTIKDPSGQVLAVFEDGATGDAHDMALKTAMSQSLKRCAMNLGDAYGLGLYDGGKTAAVVGKSLAHPDSDEHDAREAVTGGEMQSPTPEPPAAEQVPDSPAPVADPAAHNSDESDSGASSPDADVEVLRARVIDAMSLPKKDAMQALGHIGLDVSKARLKNAMTTSPAGVEMSLAALVDTALQFVSAPKPHGNPYADVVAGEPAEVAS